MCEEGADNFCKITAQFLGLPLIEHLPILKPEMSYHERVNEYYRRNDLIARDSDILVAMVAPDRTGGTENTIKYFTDKYKKKGLILL